MSAKRPTHEKRVDFGVSDLFRGLGGVFDLVSKLAESGEDALQRGGEFKGPGDVRGVYGLTIKMGLGGAPSVEHFGNIRSTEHGPEVSNVREPLVDIFDEPESILIVAELPGVDEADISVELEGDILTIKATGRERKYEKELLLPAQVIASSLQRSYQNALLEIRLNKAK
jgi:HSP20 family protein